jgi:heat shock protein HslJ
MRKNHYLLSFLALAAMLGACPAPATAGPRLIGDWPDNRAFRAVSLTDHGRPRPIVPGTTIRLSFGVDNHLGARAGCNIGSARGRVVAHRLILRGMATTRMACAPARMAQDAWVASLLLGRPLFLLTDHRLTLRNGRTQMRLVEVS